MTPPLGTFGVTRTFGNAFDRFVARSIQYVTATRDQYSHFHDATVNHAVVYVGEVSGHDKPQLVEARPGGAGFADWDNYGDAMHWITSFGSENPDTSLTPVTLTDDQRASVVAHAQGAAFHHVGYNYADFLAIALAQKRFGELIKYDDAPWWAKVLANPHRLICSQLVDVCYQRAGVNLFQDHRLPGLVSPADLYSLRLPTP